MITVVLHGPFRNFHDGPIQIQAGSAFEAIEAVTLQLKGFAPTAAGMKVARCVGYETIEDLKKPLANGETLHLVPELFLSSREGKGWTQTIIGATLIVAAIFMGGTFWPAVVASLGASLMIGGLMTILMPVPRPEADDDQNRYLGSPPNTVGIQTRIPILYGTDLVQGHILSSDIDAERV